jgi:hypothetical protein
MVGPFDDLPPNNHGLSWQNIPGTEDRYEAALSLHFSKKPQSTEGKDGDTDGSCFISLHVKQKFWMNDSKGVAIGFHYQIYGPDDNSITCNTKSVLVPFNETQRDSWRVLFVLHIIF